MFSDSWPEAFAALLPGCSWRIAHFTLCKPTPLKGHDFTGPFSVLLTSFCSHHLALSHICSSTHLQLWAILQSAVLLLWLCIWQKFSTSLDLAICREWRRKKINRQKGEGPEHWDFKKFYHIIVCLNLGNIHKCMLVIYGFSFHECKLSVTRSVCYSTWNSLEVCRAKVDWFLTIISERHVIGDYKEWKTST